MKESRNKQRTQENQPELGQKKDFSGLITALPVLARLALAFGCGLLLAFLTSILGSYSDNLGSYLFLFIALPPLLGIITPWTAGRRSPDLFLLALGAGWLVVAGIYAYWLPLAIRSDAALTVLCAHTECHEGGPLYVFLLNVFLIYGIVVVFLVAGITCLIIKWTLKREKKTETPEFWQAGEPGKGPKQ